MDPTVIAAIIGAIALLGVELLRRMLQRKRTDQKKDVSRDTSIKIEGGISTHGGITNIVTGSQQLNIELVADEAIVDLLIKRIAQREQDVSKELAALRLDVQTAVASLREKARQQNSPEIYEEALYALANGETALAIHALQLTIEQEKKLGKDHYQAAAKTARHLGAIAFAESAEASIRAYTEAVALDPADAESWNRLGVLLLKSGDFVKSESAFSRALELNKAASNLRGQALNLTDLGEVHRLRGNLQKAVELQMQALLLNNQTNDTIGLAANYANLGVLNWNMDNFTEAEKYLKRSLELEKRNNNKSGLASDHGNLGVLYLTLAATRPNSQQLLEEAERHLREAYELDSFVNNKHGAAVHLGNLGMVHSRRADFLAKGSADRANSLEKAESMVLEALDLAKKHGFKEVMANQYSNLGVIMEDRGNMAAAVRNWAEAQNIYSSIRMPDLALRMQQWINAVRKL